MKNVTSFEQVIEDVKIKCLSLQKSKRTLKCFSVVFLQMQPSDETPKSFHRKTAGKYIDIKPVQKQKKPERQLSFKTVEDTR